MIVFLERYAPSVAAIGAVLAGWGGLPSWLQSAAKADLDLSSVFGPAFDAATFAAGILFTIYILILAPTGTFVERIFGTRTFAIFHRYVTAGIVSALGLSAYSVYYVVTGLPDAGSAGERVAGAFWVGLMAYSVVAVIRVIWVFLHLVGAQARAPRRLPTRSPATP